MSLDLLAAYQALPAADRKLADAMLKAGITERWIPQEGPQSDAYFTKADETLFGGSAGGGKTDLLVGLALNSAHNAVIFRNGLGNVRDLENRAIAIQGHRNGFNGQFHYWDLEQGRSLEFGSLEQPGSEQNWQGRRRDFMGFDEATQMSRARIQFVLGWAGSAKEGARTRVVYATNPPLSDEGNFIITWFAPWLDPIHATPAKAGELRWYVNDKEGDPVWTDGPGQHDRGDGVLSTAKSRTFIPSSLSDNRYLRDTDYRSRVEALPEPMRSAMLNGNFMAARVDHAFQLIPSEWVRRAQGMWDESGRKQTMIAVGADVAGGGPDRETIARLHANNWFDRILSHQGVDTKDGNAVASRIMAAQRNGAPIGLDMTGGWGGGASTALQAAEIEAHPVIFSQVTGAADKKSRIPFANVRTEMMWDLRDALDPQSNEDIKLPPDPRVLAELTSVRWHLRGGKYAIESKDDIRTRLGVSTDVLDCICIAWYLRHRGSMKRMQGKRPKWAEQQQSGNPFQIDGV